MNGRRAIIHEVPNFFQLQPDEHLFVCTIYDGTHFVDTYGAASAEDATRWAKDLHNLVAQVEGRP